MTICPIHFIAPLFFLLLPTANATEDCESQGNWSAIQACAEGQQMTRLDAVYQETLAHVRQDNAQAADLLEKAQAAWLDFAEMSCAFTVASRLPDSNDLRFGCWQTFITAREKILAAYKNDHGKPPHNLMQP